MFRGAEYAGFDARPDLRRLAEQSTTLLANELSRFSGELSAGWEYDGRHPEGLQLVLDLELPAASGRGVRLIPLPAFGDEQELRSQFRRTWELASRSYLEKRRVVWDQLINQPVEV